MENTNGKLARKETKLTEQQTRFVHNLISGMTRREAVRDAGYSADTDELADACASRLLSNAKVYAYYTDLRAAVASEAVMDGVKWLAYMRLVAIEAISEREWNGAVAALREIGKHLGVYEIDHAQKRQHTEADVEAMRAELMKRGMDFSRKNFPTLTPPPVNGEHS